MIYSYLPIAVRNRRAIVTVTKVEYHKCDRKVRVLFVNIDIRVLVRPKQFGSTHLFDKKLPCRCTSDDCIPCLPWVTWRAWGFTSGWSGSIFQFHSCELLVLLYVLNSKCSDCVLAGPSRNCGSIPGRSQRYLFSSKHRDRPLVSHCLSEWASETLTPGDKVAEGWSHTFTHPRAFVVWCVV
jgi:hypothetical protein